MNVNNLHILYLCDKNVYLNRTSRVRFHAVEAIGRKCLVTWSGPGWENWDREKTLDENIGTLFRDRHQPDFVFCYKPFTIKGFADTAFPTCVSYNEMGTTTHPRSYTVEEVLQNHVDLVICHHMNEMLYPEFKDLPSMMVNIPHCVEKTIFKDYGLKKNIDVLLVGQLSAERYPLRHRFKQLVFKLREDPKFFPYKLGVFAHPGSLAAGGDVNREVIRFAKSLNQAKICLTCSGKYRSRYGKYAEIPACRSLLMADLPGEDHAFFRQFMAVIEDDDSDQTITDKIYHYLTHDEERNHLTDLGYRLTHAHYTQEHYAEKFLTALSAYLEQYGRKKLPAWSRL